MPAGLVAAGREMDGVALQFPGDDGGRSLGELALSDLDAALQLLADRAQYITGANGAAIALRREGRNDMQCRASSGSNVPELGSLLSTEFGLSGESVRTRQALRCDDTERDARVNRDVCREMGIASVAVMPVVNDDEVLGVFELFSGKVNAFGERDFTALKRLSEMVETAVKLAQAAVSVADRLRAGEQFVAEATEPEVEVMAPGAAAVREPEIVSEHAHARESMEIAMDVAPSEAIVPSVVPSVSQTMSEPVISTVSVAHSSMPVQPPAVPSVPSAPVQTAALAAAAAAGTATATRKALFWSAAMHVESGSDQDLGAHHSHVPPMLRNLRKCDACGFPVSPTRSLCVECEEKKWRGQLHRTAPPAPSSRLAERLAKRSEQTPGVAVPTQPVSVRKDLTSSEETQVAVLDIPDTREQETGFPAQPKLAAPATLDSGSLNSGSLSSGRITHAPEATSDFVLSAGLETSQSWLSSNKYILGALLIVAGVVAAIFVLR
ncbi:MAG TPA: GAF domain-containing protein [Candidatus Solibacter sp.]|nr:GAF domain-containing protein [Candidatus Solibacter sp.]